MYTLKKSLGQHFLNDENVCKKIVRSLSVFSAANILEVGPGGGAITKYLLELENINFKVVELDEEKVAYLTRTFPALHGPAIIHKSFLEIEPPFNEAFYVIGNFPYNISTQILFKVLEWKQLVPGVVGMFQKEVAQRVAAKEGSKVYGVTSVLVQAFYDVEYLFDVNEKCFTPPPKVMSGVIRLKQKATPLDIRSDKDFFLLVKTAFNQRRKMLRNALKPLFDAEILQQDIFLNRAEHLSINQFAKLTFNML